jgi:hypothetical protein
MNNIIWKRIAFWGVAFILAGSMAMAQKIEVGANFGYTLSEGVDIVPIVMPSGTVKKKQSDQRHIMRTQCRLAGVRKFLDRLPLGCTT